MLWLENAIGRQQSAAFSSKKKPPKFDKNDLFFRQNFCERPPLSPSDTQFKQALKKKEEMEKEQMDKQSQKQSWVDLNILFMKRLEDDANGRVFLDPETRDLLSFFTGEKSDKGMKEFLRACQADLKEAKYGDLNKNQKFVSELTLEFNELQRRRKEGIEDTTLPIKEKVKNLQLQCAFTTAVNKAQPKA